MQTIDGLPVKWMNSGVILDGALVLTVENVSWE